MNFRDESDLSHLNEHGRNILTCPVEDCGLTITHIREALTEREQAKLRTVRKESMKRHMREKHLHHSESKIKNCRHCGKRFYQKKEKLNHMLRIHNVKSTMKRIACEICEKTFISKADLMQHFQSHSAKNKPCSICGTLFTQKESAFNCMRHCRAKAKKMAKVVKV